MPATTKGHHVGKQIGSSRPGALRSMPDRGLLELFGRGEGVEAAFATLVERHATLVLRVCRQMLFDGNLAEIPYSHLPVAGTPGEVDS